MLNLQKSYLRIISGSHRLSHADPIFAKFKTLKIEDLFTQALRMFSFQLSRNSLPGGITPIFPRASHSHDTRGTRSDIYVSRSDPRSIKHLAPKIWNALSLDLKSSPSISSFKNQSKTGFIRSYSKFVCNRRPCPSCHPSSLVNNV